MCRKLVTCPWWPVTNSVELGRSKVEPGGRSRDPSAACVQPCNYNENTGEGTAPWAAVIISEWSARRALWKLLFWSCWQLYYISTGVFLAAEEKSTVFRCVEEGMNRWLQVFAFNMQVLPNEAMSHILQAHILSLLLSKTSPKLFNQKLIFSSWEHHASSAHK